MRRITQERLKQVLRYSPIVGVFEWRIAGRKIRPGYLAGAVVGTGYVRITIDRVPYPGHQLAWLYMTGEWPEEQIDHRDGDRSNNAFKNLRLATEAQNSWNSKKKKNNTSGVKGVFFCNTTKKWVASFRMNGKMVYRKFFATMDEASIAIRSAREQLQGEFANHGLHKYEQEELDAG
ncbi:HNH endonuclease [Pseudomonas syringae group genomosp. 3]|uniref:HNH endonuclease n=1 Tax=Pseudomonas syringae group genomosp. 3 TaxID=251701 RepID=UPI0010675AE2|nr:HNH endonuclease [Pseudomonas syringae group genomosp. 3]TES59157.1 HNH endonuclease [Pseudomonas syringae pv. tomato]TES74663.1 HNH endonuclease [Pseudomonas syringae pv. tomato]